VGALAAFNTPQANTRAAVLVSPSHQQNKKLTLVVGFLF
jgi:hypothetical protein